MTPLPVCRTALPVLALVASTLAARGESRMTNYSAEQAMIRNGKVEATTKLFVSDNKIRTETQAPQAEGSIMVSIFRRDTGKLFLLNPGAKAYFERALTDDDLKKFAANMVENESTRNLGTEVVNGYKCTKFQTATTVSILGMRRTTTSTAWKTDRFDFPVKVLNEDGSSMELRSIKEGKQPADLFEVPKDYRAVGNMFALFMPQGEAGEGGEQAAPPPQLPPEARDLMKNLRLPFGRPARPTPPQP